MARVWALALCFTVCVAIESTVAYQFTVGGSKGWTVPSGSDNETYNQWAERNRFQIGDTLLFKYDKSEDSVLQVSQASYNTCNTSGPIASYTDGNTIFKFLIHGPFYFISGNQSRCQLGEKLIVVVLAPCHFGKGKNCRLAPTPSPAHVPSPTPFPSPSPSPSATAPGISPTISPSPSPSPGVSSPSPSPGISSPSPSPSPGVSSPSRSPSPSPGISSPSPSPTIASVPSPSVPSPASITSPTPPAAAFPPSASTASPPSPSSSDASAYPSFLNFLIPLFFAALLNAKIATI